MLAYSPAFHAYIGCSHLLRASRLGPWTDEAYFILQSRETADAAAEALSSRATAVSRFAFETILGEARKNVLRAMRAQSAFWSFLQSPTPDMRKLHRAAEAITALIDAAEASFTGLMALNSQSVAALRMYAEFTLFVTNNVPKVRRAASMRAISPSSMR